MPGAAYDQDRFAGEKVQGGYARAEGKGVDGAVKLAESLRQQAASLHSRLSTLTEHLEPVLGPPLRPPAEASPPPVGAPQLPSVLLDVLASLAELERLINDTTDRLQL